MKNSAFNDRLQRPLRDLRISVTDRCNLRCIYCMPREIFGPEYPFLPKNEILTFEEITRLAKIFVSLGVKKIRITGGEPLLRKDIELLIEKLSNEVRIEDLALTTNGVLLTEKSATLKKNGLHRVTVSLDSLNNETFSSMNGTGVKVESVLKGIDSALDSGLNVKVNMLVMKGVNENDILPMAEYFKDKRVTVRFIEFMDTGNNNQWNTEKVFTAKEITECLRTRFELEQIPPDYSGEVALRFRYKGTQIETGIIASVSLPFCGTCNRLRLSANGRLFTCLFAKRQVNNRPLAERRSRLQVPQNGSDTDAIMPVSI